MKKGSTLSETTSEQILSMIQAEHFLPGDRLPTESELSVRFDVGRNTIREALKILASKNIIVIRQGSGTFIADHPGLADDPLGFSMIDDKEQLMDDLFQVLLILQPSIAALAAENATEDDIVALADIVHQLSASDCSRQDHCKLDAEFHCKLAESTHNLVMKNLTPVISNGISYYSSKFVWNSYGGDFYGQMLHFIQNRQSTKAQMEMQHHLLFGLHYYKKKQSKTEVH